MPPGAVAAGTCLRRVDVGGVDDAALRELIAAEAEAAERRLVPTAGVMVQALWFDAGPARAGRLWLAIHHLAVDGVSWRILVPDLAVAWQAIAAGQAVDAAAARDFVPGLGGAACGACAGCQSVAQELAFWRGMQREPSLLLSAERLDPVRDTAGHGRASDVDVAGRGDGCAADAGAGGVPWRHRRRAVDRACAGGGGLVPASCPGRQSCRPSWRQPCGAARPRRAWSRGRLAYGSPATST